MNSIFPINRMNQYADGYIRDLDTELDNLLGSFFGPTRRRGESTSFTNVPRANIAKNDEGYTIELAVPGMSREDLIISVENNTLTVSAAVENVQGDVEDMYTSKEYSFSSFARSWTLPKGVNANSIGARYHAGILAVHVPVSSEEVRKLTIDVE